MTSRTPLANAIRVLAMDAVQKANSGHPGMPMGMADIAEVLWNDFLHHSPKHPDWPNRDRFVLSNGHGSMLLYALLYLTGYDLSLEDIKQFRQLHSKTPGHPECDITPGVETTTGPLGQGLANAVGMAIGERALAAKFNRDNYKIVDHYIYVFAGDGCLMEGISHEACSLAGTLGLGKLIVFWDDNGISIDGKTSGWFNENVAARFAAYNWQVIQDVDGHDSRALHEAIVNARKVKNQPTLICCKTTIGFGAPNLAGSEKSHGAPLGEEEIAGAKSNLAWDAPPFVIPEDILKSWNAVQHGEDRHSAWQAHFHKYREAHPELADEFERRLKGELPHNWNNIKETFIQQCLTNQENTASRKASRNCLETFVKACPELIGGSADLTGSNLTRTTESKTITDREFDGNYIYYGVREFAMGAIMNGLSLYQGFIPYGGTFLTFLDYMRNAVRMSAIMKIRSIYVFTHDSIGLGEDGPTHQPVEHLSMLRATPGVMLWRPCDTTETAIAWAEAIETKNAPTCLALSRQDLPFQIRDAKTVDAIKRGGYVLKESGTTVQLIIIATGSEVALACEVASKLGDGVRVVSMPCVKRFLAQPESYRHEVLPPQITQRVAIEAGSSQSWHQFVGINGKIFGLDRFGESAPAKDVFSSLGFDSDKIVKAIEEWRAL